MQLILGTDETETEMSAMENDTLSNGNIEDIKNSINPKENQDETLEADEENATDKTTSPAQSDNEEILNYILNETSDVVNGLDPEEKERQETETVEKEDCQGNNTHDEVEPVKSQDIGNNSDTLPDEDSNKELMNTQKNSDENVNTDKTSEYDELLGIQQELLDTQTGKDKKKENNDSPNQNGESEETSHMEVTNVENKQDHHRDIVENDSISKENDTNGVIEECESEESSVIKDTCEKTQGYRENDSIDNSNEQSKGTMQESVTESESSKTDSVENEDNDSLNNDIKGIVEDVIKNQEDFDEGDGMCEVSSNLSMTAQIETVTEIAENIESSVPNRSLEDNVSIKDDLKVDDMSVEEVIENTETAASLQNVSEDDIMDVDEVVENTVTKTTEDKVKETSSDRPTKPIKLKDDDMDVQEIVDDVKVTYKELSNKQEVAIVEDSTVSDITICDIEKVNQVETTENKVTQISPNDNSGDTIELKDDMDVQEIVDDVKVTGEKLSDKQETTQVEDCETEKLTEVEPTKSKVTQIAPNDQTGDPKELKDNMDVQEIFDDVIVTGEKLFDKQETTQIEDSETEKSTEVEPTESKVTQISLKDQSGDPIESKDDMDVQEIFDDVFTHKELSNEQGVTPVEDSTVSDIPICDTEKVTEAKTTESKVTELSPSGQPIELKDDMDVQEIVDDIKVTDEKLSDKQETTQVKDSTVSNIPICKLSNTLDILSDDEDEPPREEPKVVEESRKDDPKCINLVDDDDIMVVEENKTEIEKPVGEKIDDKPETVDTETGEKTTTDCDDLFATKDEKETPEPITETKETPQINIDEKSKTEEESVTQPLLPKTFLKSAKKNLADMTREDLEEFCILRIVESIVDRSNLSELKNKLKSMEQTMEETKKKAAMLTKQNRDLQVVLISVQEEQKKRSPNAITPLKITRSVGMQVVMEKTNNMRRKPVQNTPTRQIKNTPVANQSPQRQQKTPNNQYIPVPRLVPAGNPATKSPQTPVQKVVPNGVKTPSPSVKPGEKRQHKVMSNDTVDLTDDEPPAKVVRSPVRLVSPQQLMAPQRQPFGQAVNGPRKVFIPINGQNQNAMRPGQTIMLKSVAPPGNVRPRAAMPQLPRLPASVTRMNRVTSGRHPAPLPDSAKQYQPPNWKNLPPAPDLKLSKVENGIVISWKIDGYAEDSHEEIASYQLYAYQETSSPPSTSLWKKIGDVKALPLPMACTLTQFMAGFKYYFAVRAVDVRSRLGPFSLPGSILLLNKL